MTDKKFEFFDEFEKNLQLAYAKAGIKFTVGFSYKGVSPEQGGKATFKLITDNNHHYEIEEFYDVVSSKSYDDLGMLDIRDRIQIPEQILKLSPTVVDSLTSEMNKATASYTENIESKLLPEIIDKKEFIEEAKYLERQIIDMTSRITSFISKCEIQSELMRKQMRSWNALSGLEEKTDPKTFLDDLVDSINDKLSLFKFNANSCNAIKQIELLFEKYKSLNEETKDFFEGLVENKEIRHLFP